MQPKPRTETSRPLRPNTRFSIPSASHGSSKGSRFPPLSCLIKALAACPATCAPDAALTVGGKQRAVAMGFGGLPQRGIQLDQPGGGEWTSRGDGCVAASRSRRASSRWPRLHPYLLDVISAAPRRLLVAADGPIILRHVRRRLGTSLGREQSNPQTFANERLSGARPRLAPDARTPR